MVLCGLRRTLCTAVLDMDWEDPAGGGCLRERSHIGVMKHRVSITLLRQSDHHMQHHPAATTGSMHAAVQGQASPHMHPRVHAASGNGSLAPPPPTQAISAQRHDGSRHLDQSCSPANGSGKAFASPRPASRGTDHGGEGSSDAPGSRHSTAGDGAQVPFSDFEPLEEDEEKEMMELLETFYGSAVQAEAQQDRAACAANKVCQRIRYALVAGLCTMHEAAKQGLGALYHGRWLQHGCAVRSPCADGSQAQMAAGDLHHASNNTA